MNFGTSGLEKYVSQLAEDQCLLQMSYDTMRYPWSTAFRKTGLVLKFLPS